MTITIECRKCGHAYEFTTEDIRSGDWQRRGCPVCAPIAPRKDEA